MAMTLVSTVTLSNSAANITFSNIPQDAIDLFILTSLRTDASGETVALLQYNSNGQNYTTRWLTGSGISSGSSTQTGVSAFTMGYLCSADQTSNTFSNHSLYVSNYTSSVNKTTSSDSVSENNASSARQFIAANVWQNTSAITSVSIIPGSGNLVAGSSASLYKIS